MVESREVQEKTAKILSQIKNMDLDATTRRTVVVIKLITFKASELLPEDFNPIQISLDFDTEFIGSFLRALVHLAEGETATGEQIVRAYVQAAHAMAQPHLDQDESVEHSPTNTSSKHYEILTRMCAYLCTPESINILLNFFGVPVDIASIRDLQNPELLTTLKARNTAWSAGQYVL